MMDYVLEIEGISKSFFGIPALSEVSFGVKRGHLLGLIGENGAGKSTLMNIIGGVLPSDAGCMKLDGKPYMPKNPGEATKAGIAFIHQELNLFTNLSIAENIFIDNFPKTSVIPLISRRKIADRTKELLKSISLEAAPDTLVEKLSPGERQLVEIAKALSTDARIIIFDEPTTSLTNRETERLFELINRLRKEGRSIIYISHILDDVQNLADEIVVLRDGRVTGVDSKKEFTVGKMISLMVGRDIKQIYPERNSKPSEELLLEVKNLCQAGIVHDINFNLRKGEVLGIFGLMGSGRSELARILFGIDAFEKGEIRINGNKVDSLTPVISIKNGLAFVTENRREEGLLMNVSVSDNLQLVSLPGYTKSSFKVIEKHKILEAVKEVISMLHIKCGSVDKSPVKSLSGGNQQKVVIGKWLMSKPSILIVDEPTRGIDVGAKCEVYNIVNNLAEQGTGVLMISSEIEELIGICDRIIVMSRGEIVGSFERSCYNREQILGSAFRQNIV